MLAGFVSLADPTARPVAAGPSPISTTTLARATSPEPLLALAFLSDSRLLALSASTLALVRTDAAELPTVARLALETPQRAVRTAAGLLVVDAEAEAAWLLTNRSAHAWLVACNDDRLAVRGEAEAAPVIGTPQALRYREGTNWIETELPQLGSGPFLTVELAERAWAVTTSGRLVHADAKPRQDDETRPRVGPTLAPLWPGWVAGSTTRPPGGGDALLILARRKGVVRELAALPTDESIRALASRRIGTHVRLAVASESVAGATHLTLIELRRNEP